MLLSIALAGLIRGAHHRRTAKAIHGTYGLETVDSGSSWHSVFRLWVSDTGPSACGLGDDLARLAQVLGMEWTVYINRHGPVSVSGECGAFLRTVRVYIRFSAVEYQVGYFESVWVNI